jgi:hypothetical protein
LTIEQTKRPKLDAAAANSGALRKKTDELSTNGTIGHVANGRNSVMRFHLRRLYRLLLDEAHHEVAQRAAVDAVARYLSAAVASHCAWKVGDRFEAQERPKGFWSVRSVEAVYGTNTDARL